MYLRKPTCTPGGLYRSPGCNTRYLYLGSMKITVKPSWDDHRVAYGTTKIIKDAYIRYTKKLEAAIIPVRMNPDATIQDVLTAVLSHIEVGDPSLKLTVIHGDFAEKHMPVYFGSVTKHPDRQPCTITRSYVTDRTVTYEIEPF